MSYHRPAMKQRDITDVYFDGVTNFINSLNTDQTRYAKVRFSFTHRDKHIAERAVERNVDIVSLIQQTKNEIRNNLCSIVYAVHSGEGALTIRTQAGHMAFRCWRRDEFDEYMIRLCTITPRSYRHDRDFMIGS
jgi:hypothetical protein